MIWLFLTFALFLVLHISLETGKEINGEYLSMEQTQTIKGIFICIVFFSHFHGYVTYTSAWDDRVRWATELLGQTMVAPFLFYSGYGIMVSMQRKGSAYVAAIPRKRILSTLLRFDCAVVLFVLLALATGEDVSVKRVLLSLVAWESMGNSYWYIFAVLMLYLITYCAFTICKEPAHGVLLSFVLVSIGIFCFAHWNLKDICWYDTALCYVLGMVYALYRERFEDILNRSRILYIFLVTVALILVLFMKRYEFEPIGSCFRTSLFALTVAAITMRVKVSSKLLRWCGEHLFPLYILQRLPMIALQYIGMGEWSIPVYFLCCVGITLLLVRPFEWITDLLWNQLNQVFAKKHAAI